MAGLDRARQPRRERGGHRGLANRLLSSGFGVADTHVLFRLAPSDAATPVLVVSDVVSNLAYGLAPVAAGLAIDAALGAGLAPARVYHVLLISAAAVTLLSLRPLRIFGREGDASSGT